MWLRGVSLSIPHPHRGRSGGDSLTHGARPGETLSLQSFIFCKHKAALPLPPWPRPLIQFLLRHQSCFLTLHFC